MKTQTALGWLFVLIGLVILVVALAPAMMAIAAHGPHVDPSLTLLAIGIAVLTFGAWLLPSSHVGTTVREVRVELADTTLPWIGKRTSATTTVQVTTDASPSAPPKEGA